MQDQQRLSQKKLFLFYTIYILGLLVLFEGGTRQYWKNTRKALFFGSPKRVLHQMLYPELKNAEQPRESGTLDILVLGASAVTEWYGKVPSTLQSELSKRTSKKIRLINIAMPAHSSRDDYIKYKFLKDRPFDLVLLYDGMNEVRANNCPREVFRKDYSHYSWYRQTNLLLNPVATSSIFAFTLEYLFDHYAGVFSHREMIPTNAPSPAWMKYGVDIKTGPSLEENYSRIIELAQEKHEPLIFTTIAFYLPKNYTREKFESKKLDYHVYVCPVEIWGTPKAVETGIDVHNQIIENLSKKNPDTPFVDEGRLIPKQAKYFDDICHFSPEGSELFVKNLLPTMIRLLKL